MNMHDENHRFRFTDASNNFVYRTSWELPQKTGVNAMSEFEYMTRDLQKSLEVATSERDYWKTIALTLAESASKSASVFYGRTIDYIIRHAEIEAHS